MNRQGNNHQKPCTLGQSPFWNTQSDQLPHQGITRKHSPKTQHTQTMTETAAHPQYLQLKHLVWLTSLPGYHKETITKDSAYSDNGRDSHSSSVLYFYLKHLVWPTTSSGYHKENITQNTQTMTETVVHPQDIYLKHPVWLTTSLG